MQTLSADGVTAVLQGEAGGRIASLVVDGLELLVTEADRPIDWGLFPMAPFAGRVRHGRIAFDGREHQLPLTLPPHAIHGTLVTRAWRDVASGVVEVELDDPWPFAGRARHEVVLAADHLTATLTVEADEPMPAWVGWHPWFRRRLGRGRRAGLTLPAGGMLVRDGESIPTGEVVPIPDGPWDDCFTDLASPPSIEWAGALTVEVESDCGYAVVFTEPLHGFCVEPQSAPPDALNLGLAPVAAPGAPVRASMTLRWRRPTSFRRQ
ncbi:MAG TPA: hypothetical protein VF230_03165 [Acidimicrobiales bacterium]